MFLKFYVKIITTHFINDFLFQKLILPWLTPFVGIFTNVCENIIRRHFVNDFLSQKVILS